MSDTNPRRVHGAHVAGIIATVFCVLAALLLLANKQYVLDQLSVWQYKPDAEISALAARSGMNDTGKFYFYASHPAIDGAQEFNQECEHKESGTAILGCYNGRNIYIYNVTDAQLDGIKEVTAAHEMLHAAYARMSDGEKKSVDKLLEAEYNKLKNDKDFSERVAFYARTEPGERDNELHSVIGTEVANVSPALEAHYKKYFSDRSKVVALHDKYASVFTALQAKSDALSRQLTQLGDAIESGSAQYNADVTQLNADIETYNVKAKGGGFSSQAEFHAEFTSLKNRTAELESRRQAINSEITQYNSLRQELASVSSRSQALNRSIDSSLAPAPSL